MIADARARLFLRFFNLPLQLSRKDTPKPRVRFDESNNISKILYALALTTTGIAPGRNLARQSILKRGDAKKDSMNIGGNRPGWERMV